MLEELPPYRNEEEEKMLAEMREEACMGMDHNWEVVEVIGKGTKTQSFIIKPKDG